MYWYEVISITLLSDKVKCKTLCRFCCFMYTHTHTQTNALIHIRIYKHIQHKYGYMLIIHTHKYNSHLCIYIYIYKTETWGYINYTHTIVYFDLKTNTGRINQKLKKKLMELGTESKENKVEGRGKISLSIIFPIRWWLQLRFKILKKFCFHYMCIFSLFC